ncbi:hypothetical protein ABE137_12025 [Brevibacillus laterosporus]|uniref:hypothetical protein n=1 Tax=Brevibacillus phage Sundance TaxID=1691958 RepID=UPI0006BCB8B4|nr:hypothetical protein AVT09_gp073 [Brevibacillus phage Sundance]ALA47889.1 hypothetical protein SUNDANCE_73 [Brevibacillus phage Sundance]
MSAESIVYKLSRYTFGDYEEVVFENEDKDVVVKEALKRSTDDSHLYAYRLEVWKGDCHIGRWRFFQDGKEFTNAIRKAVEMSIQGKTK